MFKTNIKSMKNQFYKSTGTSLITGSLFIIATMILHPSGGNTKHIIQISTSLIVVHSLAIFCLPILLFGCYGLTNSLLEKSKISVLAFIIMGFGCIATMFAAVVNGLTLPYFLKQYVGNLEQNASIIKPIMNYGFAINKPLDYIFIVACCLAIFIYSILIIRTNKFPKWIGYFGVLLISFCILGAFTGFVFTSLTGFRVFVFSLAGWILSSGVSLIRSKEH